MKKGTVILISVVALVAIIALWAMSAYNKLVVAEESVTTEWANVESQYQRRADLIPNLVSTVKGYAAHEQETLDAVVSARAKATQMTVDAKDLTPENIEYIKHVYYQEMLHVEKMEILSKKFNVAERTIRGWWQKLDLSKLPTNLPPQLQKAQDRVLNKNTKVLLVTTAQNKTSVNKDFLTNLVAYKD